MLCVKPCYFGCCKKHPHAPHKSGDAAPHMVLAEEQIATEEKNQDKWAEI